MSDDLANKDQTLRGAIITVGEKYWHLVYKFLGELEETTRTINHPIARKVRMDQFESLYMLAHVISTTLDIFDEPPKLPPYKTIVEKIT